MEPVDHDRIDELLAGYALRSLSGDDAAETDRLLSEHVPTCARCRTTLIGLGDTVADLAFAVDPVDPPETLLPRLHRELEPRGRRATGRWAGVAAGVAVVVAAGVALSQGMRAADFQESNELVGEVLQYLQLPGATSDALVDGEAQGESPMAEVSAPDAGHFYLVGTDVPPPPAGTEYGIWLSDGVTPVFAGSFPPGSGVRVVRIPFDRSRFDRVIVTIEELGAEPGEPGPPVWEAAA